LSNYYLRNYAEALADFSKATDINPEYALAYYYRGAFKVLTGQKESGCIDLRKAEESGFIPAIRVIREYCQ
jgi:tetratricopeptide (TPR) repeat protein